MISLNQRCDIWRMMAKPAGAPGKQLQVWRKSVPCLVQPISSFDALPDFARESTHVAFVPRWLAGVLVEDELRTGRRTDNTNTVVQLRYGVDGQRRWRFGFPHLELFLKEKT